MAGASVRRDSLIRNETAVNTGETKRAAEAIAGVGAANVVVEENGFRLGCRSEIWTGAVVCFFIRANYSSHIACQPFGMKIGAGVNTRLAKLRSRVWRLELFVWADDNQRA